MPEPLLSVTGLDAYYGDFQALFSVNLNIRLGETVALVGANGAGKSTLLKSITGLLPPRADSIRFAGKSLFRSPAHKITRLGVALVPEGRRLFSSLSVEENLLMATGAGRPGAWTLETVYDLFPVLRERRRAPGTALSGGQQQMIAIGRALIANPKLALFDEISLGLAPVVIDEIYRTLRRIRAQGTTLLIVEQDVRRAVEFSD